MSGVSGASGVGGGGDGGGETKPKMTAKRGAREASGWTS